MVVRAVPRLATGEEDFESALARRLLVERAEHLAELDRAVADASGANLASSLQEVCERLPLAASVELAMLHVRGSDGDCLLHLVAATGVPMTELRRLVVAPITIPHARAMFALGGRHSAVRDLGLRWLQGVWLRHGDEPIGLLTAGSRTLRRPGEEELAVLGHVAERLAHRLEGVERASDALSRATAGVARSLSDAAPSLRLEQSPLSALRPRERTILELFAEGLSTAEVAELLVISPHTVRTHVKNALQRLGVHSRETAVELLQRERVARLL
jgi:DNA-binding CsgD family transcriptional regulator